MTRRRFSRFLSSLALIVFVAPPLGVPTRAQQATPSGITSFVFDGNRIYAELVFVRPDGGLHRALAFVDLGTPSMTVTDSLFNELQLDRKRPLEFRVGDLPVRMDASAVTSDPEKVLLRRFRSQSRSVTARGRPEEL